jgi:hypothetical protein
MVIPGGVARWERTAEERQLREKNQGDRMTASISGRPRTVSRKRKGDMSSSKKKTVKDEMTVQVRHRKESRPGEERGRSTGRGKPLAGAGSETAVIIHEQDRKGSVSVLDSYLKNRGIVHRAMELLEAWKYLPARITSARIPVDIIALHDDMDMLVQVISSKHPIRDVNTLYRNYAKKIDSLRLMGMARRYRKILMAYSLPSGWKHYDVLPGGLIPAWDLYKLPVAQPC